MSVPGEARFLDALRALRDGLDAARAPWLVIGGVAVIARGIARYTADVDATVWTADTDPAALIETLRARGIAPRVEDAEGFARRHQVLLLKHEATGIPIDVSLAWLPFEEEAIRAGEACDYAGVKIRVPRPDDLVVYELVAARPRDVDDAEKLILLYGPKLDLPRIRRLVGEFALALEDRTRVETLDRLLRRAGLGG